VVFVPTVKTKKNAKKEKKKAFQGSANCHEVLLYMGLRNKPAATPTVGFTSYNLGIF
jgi:hypothetical protein